VKIIASSLKTDQRSAAYSSPIILGRTQRRRHAMEDFYEELARVLEAGEPVAVATVVKTRGSTPREVGAKMMVRPSGQIIGTVGGGCGEAAVWRAALEVIETGKPRIVVADLTEDISLHAEGVCGGIMEIYVEPWYPSQRIPASPSQEH
jgi:xanthine dehydrogenase accessory factor